MSTGALPGFRDFYPEQFAERAWLFERWRYVAQRFGFAEYDGPPLEPLDLYTKKSGDEIVGQLFNFEDKGGRQVALRPEMTPTVARMVAARANALRRPVRWFSIPQLFRYERQQKGRLREHFQLNVDIFGESGVAADAELLAVACEIIRSCGLGPDDVVARVSDRRLLTAVLRAMGVREELLPAVFKWVDKIEKMSKAEFYMRLEDDGVEARLAQRISSVVNDSTLETLRRNFSDDSEVSALLDHLDEYYDLVRAHGVAEYFKLDLRIVRGLDYYTGVVFELFDAKREFRALCGGGRYDGLLKALGGVDMPALGFGMGDVVLGELIRARVREQPHKLDPWWNVLPRVDFWIVVPEGEGIDRSVRAATKLREAGFSVELPLRPMTVSKQWKAASSARARFRLEPASGGAADLYRLKKVLDSPPKDVLAVEQETLADRIGDNAVAIDELLNIVTKEPELLPPDIKQRREADLGGAIHRP